MYGITHCLTLITLGDTRRVIETTHLPPLRERFFLRERRSVPAARLFARETLSGWGLAEAGRGDDVLLCVSELATNALLHGVPPGRQFRVFLRYDGRVLHVEVHDSGPGTPRVAHQADENERWARAAAGVRARRQMGCRRARTRQGGVVRVRLRTTPGPHQLRASVALDCQYVEVSLLS